MNSRDLLASRWFTQTKRRLPNVWRTNKSPCVLQWRYLRNLENYPEVKWSKFVEMFSKHARRVWTRIDDESHKCSVPRTLPVVHDGNIFLAVNPNLVEVLARYGKIVGIRQCLQSPFAFHRSGDPLGTLSFFVYAVQLQRGHTKKGRDNLH